MQLPKSIAECSTKGFVAALAILTSLGIAAAWSPGDVVINELMWMGTSHSVYDEYIEFRNFTSTNLDFSSTPWSLYKNGSFMTMIDEGNLSSHGYFLIARSDTAFSALAITPDIITNTLVLNNSDAQYILYAGPSDTFTLIDIADDGVGAPMAGSYGGFAGSVFWSMERNETPGDGTLPENWHTGCLTVNFRTDAIERGTPAADNFKNTPPTWDGVIAPLLAIDDSNLAFNVLTCFDYDGVPDSLQVICKWRKIGESHPIFTSTIYGVPTGDSVTLIIPHEYTQAGEEYHWSISLDDGKDTLHAAGTLFVHFNQGNLIIDEICWGGSSRSTSDEWLEIFSLYSDTVFFEQTPLYLWHTAAGGVFSLAAEIDEGVLPPDGRWLIKRLDISSPHTAVHTMPNLVLPELSLPDGAILVMLTDHPDTNYIIDVAGWGGFPPAGEVAWEESLWATMARIHPCSNGRDAESWRTSTVSQGFIDGVFDRGSPGSADIINTPPQLIPIDSLPIFTPDTGTGNTIFEFRILYRDADGNAPDSAVIIIDKNNDGELHIDEVFSMTIEFGDDFYSGVCMRADISELTPTLDGENFTFRASDGFVITPFPIPAFCGPIVLPTVGLLLSTDEWRTDTLYQRIDRLAMSSPVQIRNTGDLPAIVELMIADEDTFEYDCCASPCQGGWISSCNPGELACNRYMLSAVFLPDGITPDSMWFNTTGVEDCLMPDEYCIARGDSLGYMGFCAAENLAPNSNAYLWILMQLPLSSVGLHSDEDHIIILKLRMTVGLP